MTPDVIVVGGGIAGLVTAWEIQRHGGRALLLEATAALGGCVRAHTVGGLRLDAGADSYAVARPSVSDLITDLGLPSYVVAPNPVGAWVRHEAGTAPLPRASLLGIPSDPRAADVRAIIGAAGALRARLDDLLPARVGDADGVALGPLVRRRLGRRVLRRLVEPVAGGVYSSDPEELEVDSVAPRLRAALAESGSLAGAVASLRGNAPAAGSLVAGLEGGMATLTERLAQAVLLAGGEIHREAVVTSLARSGDGWVVTTGGPGAGSIEAASVVLALPGLTASRLLEAALPGRMPPLGAKASNVLLCTLVLDCPQLDAAPRGTGILVSAHAHGVAAKALTHATAKWAYLATAAGRGHHVLRLSYGRGGGETPDPSLLPKLALTDASELMGVTLDRAQLVDHAVVAFSDALPRPGKGHAAAVARSRAALAPYAGLALTGSFVAGTGLAAVVADARATARELWGTMSG